jgi:hypothetical protein
MPAYNFKNINTGEEWTTIMSNTEREEFLEQNKHIQQQLNSAPALGYSIVTKKPDAGFRDRLKEIKKAHSKGFTRSTVNTF